MLTIEGIAGLRAHAGRELGCTDWCTIDQERVDRFAEATDDHQWIHIDPARAADGPYGGTIAHGFLTLSLLPRFTAEVVRITGIASRINYGLEKVRFPAPVPVGARIRDRIVLDSLAEVPGNGARPDGVRIVLVHTIEVDGGERPACVAHGITLLLPEKENLA